MLLATFNDTTTWQGKRIERMGERLFIEGVGQAAPQDVFCYEAAGQIEWVSTGARALVIGMISLVQPLHAAQEPASGAAKRPRFKFKGKY